MEKHFVNIERKYGMEVDLNNESGGVTVTGRVINKVSLKPIPMSEPLFLLRAQDKMALPALIGYKLVCSTSGCSEEHLKSIDEAISQFANFQAATETKMPD
jgi:hypothetical protein